MTNKEKRRIQKNASALRIKKTNAKAVIEFRRNNKWKLIKYKGGKCQRCGYDKPFPTAYHFHHRDRATKEFTVSRYMSRKFERLIDEVDKCDLICGNCHAELHDEEICKSLERTIKNLKELDIEETAKRKRKARKTKTCKQCKNRYEAKHKTQKFCSTECRIESQKKPNKPTSRTLAKLLKDHSWTEMGRKYGVSDNTIRNWAKAYGLLND